MIALPVFWSMTVLLAPGLEIDAVPSTTCPPVGCACATLSATVDRQLEPSRMARMMVALALFMSAVPSPTGSPRPSAHAKALRAPHGRQPGATQPHKTPRHAPTTALTATALIHRKVCRCCPLSRVTTIGCEGVVNLKTSYFLPKTGANCETRLTPTLSTLKIGVPKLLNLTLP